MGEAQWGIEIMKVVGFPALLFFVWYLYHRSETEKWKIYLAQVQVENKQQFELFKSGMIQQERAREQMFLLLKETIETVSYHSQMLSRVEQKMDTNQFCPLVRKEPS
jgi:hypothetical protein